MAVDNVQVNTKTGIDGNSYTTAVSNNKLTNADFLKLMLEELKMQDPTKPMDSQRMLDSQMQMSSIETNLKTIETMESLAKTFSQSALSSATAIIGKNIENGNVGENGVNKAFTVRSIENINGEVKVKAQQILYIEDQVQGADGKNIVYDINGFILDAEGKKTDFKVALKNVGKVITKDGLPVILDKNLNEVSNSGYTINGQVVPVYSDKLVSIPFNSITKIF